MHVIQLTPITTHLWEAYPVIRDRRYLVQIWCDSYTNLFWAIVVRIPNPKNKTLLSGSCMSYDDALSTLNTFFAPSRIAFEVAHAH
jgi:hypothetical protein